MGNLTNIIIVLTAINIVCIAFSSAFGISTMGDIVVNALFNSNSITTPNPSMNTQFDSGFNKQISQTESGLNNFFNFVDGLKKIFYLLINALSLGFAIFIMMTQTGTPYLITLLIGLPIAIGYYMAIIGAVRGVDI